MPSVVHLVPTSAGSFWSLYLLGNAVAVERSCPAWRHSASSC